MLNLAEYIATQAELTALGRQLESEMTPRLKGLNKSQGIKLAKTYADEYTAKSQAIIDTALKEMAHNAATHYANQLNLDLADEEVNKMSDNVVNGQYTVRYYGATLRARLAIGQKILARRIVRTAQIRDKEGTPHKLDTVFTKPIPFGAQVNLDKRLVLSTAAKIENDLARLFAEKSEDVHFIRWTLSHKHVQRDLCDMLATSVDERVVQYLQENNLLHRPEGLYFANELPQPPHPNCQCEYALVMGDGTATRGILKRTAQKVRKILRIIRGK